ncbi:MAG: exodeoxyribonuclease VII large subunit [Alphaproteobacteria bacterium]|nr:exodeoxyribonuclease VII large subunit [Alphaproteobacteria bacterium]
MTVTELSQSIKRTVEGSFARVTVKGEISGYRPASSGHLYFDLKDAESVIAVCCWRPQPARLGFKPEEGLEVIAHGRVTTYPKSSKYQLILDSMEPAGIGQLLAKIEQLRVKLLGEGLFDPARKPPLPFLPETIGLITSESGAVLQDIRHRIRERLPRPLILWPVLVQGDGASAQIVAAIQGFNRMVPLPSVLIIARGGGSAVDLMAFNEEAVVRAAAASTIPIISAIGHETDTPLLDYAATLRAPTPTAAAEFAVPERNELRRRLLHNHSRLFKAMAGRAEQGRLRLAAFKAGLSRPQSLLDSFRRELDQVGDGLDRAASVFLAQRQQRLELVGGRLPPPQQQWQAAKTRLDHLGASADRALLVWRDKVAAALRYHGDRVTGLGQRLEMAFDLGRVWLRPQALASDGSELFAAAGQEPGQVLTLVFYDGNIAAEVIEQPESGIHR